MTDVDLAQVKLAVDAVLAAAHLSVTAEEYERLLHTYSGLQTTLADLRFPEARYLAPADVYRP